MALLMGQALWTQEVSNGLVTVRAVKGADGYTGFDLSAKGTNVALVRLSSSHVRLRAARCSANSGAKELVFTGLGARADAGLRLNAADTIRVRLKPGDPYPVVAFDLQVTAFDPIKWKASVGAEPFHFLALYLAEAEVWHQRGWLNATPVADRFPLLEDRHVGSPEISAFHYNRNWSYTPPLGAHPLPVIGLWAPKTKSYVGFEFQTTRLEDNSEKDVATGYRWEEPSQGADAGQFVALVYPYGGQGYQQLEFPMPQAKLKSHGTLLWSRNLPSTDDPNHFFWSFLWERAGRLLPRVPAVPDLNWIPGGLRQNGFAGPASGSLIGGVEKPFQVEGSKVLYGWGWHNESPTAAPARRGETNRLQGLEKEAQQLEKFAKKFQSNGDDCVYWEKPLAGEWTPEWGGKPVTTLHNANGFAAGRLFLGLYRDAGKSEYLPVVDGVLNWARHIVWTRNEFADVPSSPFAIGGTLSASFCLEYYMTFKQHPEPRYRERAKLALELARSFTYRYMVLWPSDNNRDDNLDATFLWEPNSGRDWTGAACANEVFWNLDTLAQTAVHTGDPVLMWALQGSLSRWHLLYQDVLKDKLSDYQAANMTEGYGLYAGNVYGLGVRAGYGFAAPLVMTEPVGNSTLRVLAGEQAALAFRKGTAEIADYRYRAPGNLSFTVRAAQPKFELSLTVPYVDISAKPVAVMRAGKRLQLKAEEDFQRPPRALWSLYLKNLMSGDRVLVGEGSETGPSLPVAPPLVENTLMNKTSAGTAAAMDGFAAVPLPGDCAADQSWDNLEGWAGVPSGRFWAYGVPFELAPDSPRGVTAKTVKFSRPIRGVDLVFLLYSAGDGPAPSLLDGQGRPDTALPRTEALAWRAWPPMFNRRLLIAKIPVPKGASFSGLEPAGRTVWAITTYGQGKANQPPKSFARFEQGAAEWQRMRQEEIALKSLREAALTIPQGTVAILPPSPAGPAYSLVQRAGILKRAVVLDSNQLVDPALFNARRMPVALYLDGEDYVHTVKTPGDGAAAVERYVKEGGTLVLLPSLPWPLFYANGPGFHRAEAITDKLGLPLMMASEGPSADPLLVHTLKQTVIKMDAAEFPFPSGDPRLRSIERSRIAAGAKYTPIAAVISRAGKDLGEAAGLVELPGGGRVLYVAGNLQRDPVRGFAFIESALRFVIEAAAKRQNTK